MLTLLFNQLWLHEVLLIVMVALTWSGYISLYSHHTSIINEPVLTSSGKNIPPLLPDQIKPRPIPPILNGRFIRWFSFIKWSNNGLNNICVCCQKCGYIDSLPSEHGQLSLNLPWDEYISITGQICQQGLTDEAANMPTQVKVGEARYQPTWRLVRQGTIPPEGWWDRQGTNPPKTWWNRQGTNPAKAWWDRQGTNPPKAWWDRQSTNPPEAWWDNESTHQKLGETTCQPT